MDNLENSSSSEELSVKSIANSKSTCPVEETANVDSTGLQVINRDPAILEVRAGPTESVESDIEAAGAVVEVAPETSFKGASSAENYLRLLSTKQVHALRLLAPAQVALLVQYVHTMRKQRLELTKRMECAFCKRNGEDEAWYAGHALKDWRGRVLCPVLRSFRCPRCGATGDRAHTIKYCPENGTEFVATLSGIMKDLMRDSINKNF